MKVNLFLSALLLASISVHAQIETINENFQSFTTGTSASWPQNGWSKVVPPGAGPYVYADGSDNKYIQFYSLMAPNTAGYLITPQIVAPDGAKSLQFTYAMNTGSAAGGTLEVGMISAPTTAGTSSFTSISPVYSLNSLTQQTVTISVPASSNQYIAFKFIGSAQHVALKIDDIIYNTSGNLSVSNAFKNNHAVKFFVNAENTALQFVSKQDPKNITIYTMEGKKVAEGKVKSRTFDISTLQTGVYITVIETNNDFPIRSKFIKK